MKTEPLSPKKQNAQTNMRERNKRSCNFSLVHSEYKNISTSTKPVFIDAISPETLTQPKSYKF